MPPLQKKYDSDPAPVSHHCSKTSANIDVQTLPKAFRGTCCTESFTKCRGDARGYMLRCYQQLMCHRDRPCQMVSCYGSLQRAMIFPEKWPVHCRAQGLLADMDDSDNSDVLSHLVCIQPTCLNGLQRKNSFYSFCFHFHEGDLLSLLTCVFPAQSSPYGRKHPLFPSRLLVGLGVNGQRTPRPATTSISECASSPSL